MPTRHPVRLSSGINVRRTDRRRQLAAFAPPHCINENEGNVDPFESSAHSFIVKIWLEDASDEFGSARWRGHITHVPSRQRRYVEDLNGISSFIAMYLEGMGVPLEDMWPGVMR